MAEKIPNAPVIIRRKQVEARTGLSRSSIYAAISAGTFPAPIGLGEKSVGWLEHEISAWILSRVEASRKLPNAIGGNHASAQPPESSLDKQGQSKRRSIPSPIDLAGQG